MLDDEIPSIAVPELEEAGKVIDMVMIRKSRAAA
jgi:hypothetical protein